jgi:hypothetical protein
MWVICLSPELWFCVMTISIWLDDAEFWKWLKIQQQDHACNKSVTASAFWFPDLLSGSLIPDAYNNRFITGGN